MSANAAEVGDGAADPELCMHADPTPAPPTPAPTAATALMKPRRPSRPISADVISPKVGSVIVISRHQQTRRAKLPKSCNADVARTFRLFARTFLLAFRGELGQNVARGWCPAEVPAGAGG